MSVATLRGTNRVRLCIDYHPVGYHYRPIPFFGLVASRYTSRGKTIVLTIGGLYEQKRFFFATYVLGKRGPLLSRRILTGRFGSASVIYAFIFSLTGHPILFVRSRINGRI